MLERSGRRAVGLALVGLLGGAVLWGRTEATPQLPTPRPVATMAELMSEFILPASDAVFYIESRTPATPEDWNALVGWTLMLAESGNLLLAPERAPEDDRWAPDAELLRVAGAAALEAARRRDVAGLVAASDALYESCTTCHGHFRPGYGSRE